jgi:two-component system, cell cycle sensor histidine kinase and response regulator CckA
VAAWWATLGNLVIALSYALISAAIIVPVVRARQVRSNRLATATALIFFSCAIGHGLHALAAWRAAAGGPGMPGMHDGASGWGWPSAGWDLFTAGVGVYYWTLRRGYGVLLGGLYVDPGQRARLDEAEQRERATSTRAAEQQGLYVAVVEHSEDSIIATDLDDRVLLWNAGAERMFGYSAEETVGRSTSSFVAPGTNDDRSPLVARLVARLVAGERGIRYEATARHHDGTHIDVAVTMSPIIDAAGTVVGTARITRDLTEVKQAEASQRAAEQQVAQAQRMASLGQLAGGVAHDFNNLLGIILNFTAFAAEETDDPAAVKADLAKARLAGERAVGLTRQLLTFTRQDTVRPELLDVNASIAEAHDLLARTIGAHITLITTPAPTQLLIYADGGRVQQVLVNLAINARDAMPDGGTLVIGAKAVDLDAGQVSLKPAPPAGRYVQFLVSDTGTGMSAEVVAKIFEPFYTTKPKGHGTGLGLATVYGIITEAAGSINVYSEPGIGTTFRVYFPIAAGADRAVPAPQTAADAPRGDGQTILVAEDEPELGAAVARILTERGYRPLSAAGGPQALELDAVHGCDLLLTDVVMPDMSGRQLAKALQHRHPSLRVLYMSGYTNGVLDAANTPDYGVTVIEKPFTAHLLLTEIDTMLHQAAVVPEPPGG